MTETPIYSACKHSKALPKKKKALNVSYKIINKKKKKKKFNTFLNKKKKQKYIHIKKGKLNVRNTKDREKNK